jgi:hypothetical protein
MDTAKTLVSPETSAERAWWLRALLVLQSPRAVFAALRDDSDDAAQARAEPVLALLLLAGIAGVLGTNAGARILDDFDVDAPLLAVWAFVSGMLYGAATFWGVGALVLAGIRLAGGRGGYRRARHLLAYAAAPLALSLVVWPVRLAVYGDDVFRTGGSDHGFGNVLFEGIELGALLWAIALVVVGIRTVEPFGWWRAAAAAAIPALVPAIALGAAYGVL